MSAATSTDWTITLLPGVPDAELLRQVRALADAAEESDGNPPLSEQTLVRLRTNDDAGTLLGAYARLAEAGDGEGRWSASPWRCCRAPANRACSNSWCTPVHATTGSVPA